jgi:signal transduction histidine kinase
VRVAGRAGQIPNVNGRYLFVAAEATNTTLGPAANLVAVAFSAFVAFCAAAVASVALLQVHFGLEPLRKLSRDIASVRKGQAERLEGEYAEEVAPLADELNALLQHNREVVERARRHVGNLAHALKTPIAVLKNAADEGGASQTMLRGAGGDMERFVERQLRRARVAARAEARAGVHAVTLGYRTPVKENLEDLVFMMEQQYEHKKAIDIMLDAPGDVTFRGEREDLLEMAANLVDNACKYGKSQVAIRVEPPASPGGLFEIVVEDDGEGLTDEEIALVLERGARLDEAAPGQGLGLSILTEAVSLYAGELKFERSALGGLKARLRLPATD